MTYFDIVELFEMDGTLQVVTTGFWSSSFSRWFGDGLLQFVSSGNGSEIGIAQSRRILVRCLGRWRYRSMKWCDRVMVREFICKVNFRWQFWGRRSGVQRGWVWLVWKGYHLFMCGHGRWSWQIAKYSMRCYSWKWCWCWTRLEERGRRIWANHDCEVVEAESREGLGDEEYKWILLCSQRPMVNSHCLLQCYNCSQLLM